MNAFTGHLAQPKNSGLEWLTSKFSIGNSRAKFPKCENFEIKIEMEKIRRKLKFYSNLGERLNFIKL